MNEEHHQNNQNGAKHVAFKTKTKYQEGTTSNYQAYCTDSFAVS